MRNRPFIPLITYLFACTLLLAGCVSSSGMPWERPNTNVPAPVRQSSTQVETAPAQNPSAAAFNNLPPVNVAILLPLSGPKSAVGDAMLQAAQLSLFEMGYTNFNLMPRDTKGTATGASAAAAGAIKDNAQIILGPLFSDSVRAVKTVAKQHNINVIAFSTDWTLADSSTFMMGFMPFSQVDRITEYATQRGYRNFAVIAPRDQYGDLVADRFQQKIRNLEGNIANTIRFTPGDPAVINQVASLKPADGEQPLFNAVFMPVGGTQTEVISSALSYNRLMPSQIKRIGTGLWDDPRIAQQPNMQGAWFAGPSPLARARFEQQFMNTYGQKPIRLATLAYDATSLTAILARNGFINGNAPDFSYAALTDPNGFAGTDGIFRFNRNGLVERGLAVLEIRNNNIVEIAPAPKQF